MKTNKKAIDILNQYEDKLERYGKGHDEASQEIIKYLKGVTIVEARLILSGASIQLDDIVINTTI